MKYLKIVFMNILKYLNGFEKAERSVGHLFYFFLTNVQLKTVSKAFYKETQKKWE
jgi:hypothetical protein